MEVPGNLGQGIARRRKLLHGELEQGLVVGLEMDLPAGDQGLPVEVQKAPVGQPPLGLPHGGPGVAEVNVNEVHLAGGEVIRQQRRVPHHEEHILQLQGHDPLHRHHHGVGHLLNGHEQDVRIQPGGFRRKAALAAAQLHPQLPGAAHQRLLPASAQGEAVLHLACRAFFHSGNKIFLFPHPHCVLPPAQFSLDCTTPWRKRQGPAAFVRGRGVFV